MNRSVKSILVSVVVAILAVGMGLADGVDVTAHITADNHYALFWGNASGSDLNYVGRNETDPVLGSMGQYNWSVPETWGFSTDELYVYVVAWDRLNSTVSTSGGPQMWIGDFLWSPDGKLVSNLTDWEFYVSGNDNPAGGTPSVAQVQGDISAAVGAWSNPLVSAANGTSPWGTIPDVDPTAQFVWHDTFDNVSSSDNNYVIFRAKIVVPEPASLLLLGLGLLGAGLIRRRS